MSSANLIITRFENYYWLDPNIYKHHHGNNSLLHKIHNGNIRYRKLSNIRRTKSQNLDVYRLGLQLSLRNILKPSVEWRMKM